MSILDDLMGEYGFPVPKAAYDKLQEHIAARQPVGQEPVAVLLPGAPTRCKHCESTDLEWFAHIRALNDVQHGRLTTHDVGSVFALGCNECSETLHVVKADAIAQLLAAPPAQAVVPEGYVLSLIPKEDTAAFNAACTAAHEESRSGTGPCGVFIAGYRHMRANAPEGTAQAVDLGQFREAVQSWYSTMRKSADCGALVPEMQKSALADVEEAKRMLALIDKAVGNG